MALQGSAPYPTPSLLLFRQLLDPPVSPTSHQVYHASSKVLPCNKPPLNTPHQNALLSQNDTFLEASLILEGQLLE